MSILIGWQCKLLFWQYHPLCRSFSHSLLVCFSNYSHVLWLVPCTLVGCSDFRRPRHQRLRRKVTQQMDRIRRQLHHQDPPYKLMVCMTTTHAGNRIDCRSIEGQGGIAEGSGQNDLLSVTTQYYPYASEAQCVQAAVRRSTIINYRQALNDIHASEILSIFGLVGTYGMSVALSVTFRDAVEGVRLKSP